MNIWSGRIDGEENLYHRVFQRVISGNQYSDIAPGDYALHGFAVDEGVRRNLGRTGASNAPDIIRKNMAAFPVWADKFVLRDFKNITCENGELESAQQQLTNAITKTLTQGGRSVVLGGGHEVMFGHYSGVKKAFPGKRIGVISMDAHFDNREPLAGVGASSGTGFWQLAKEGGYQTLHLGIQRNSNTPKLFELAKIYGMPYVLADAISTENLPVVMGQIDNLLNSVEILYMTICMDVFNAAIAPGVSAPAYNGIFADTVFMRLYRYILSSKKLIALDVAEVNPLYDSNERTARLAAALINEWFMIPS